MKIKKTAENGKAPKDTQTVDTPLYEIIMQDECNDLYQLGFYQSLDDAIEDINDFIGAYDDDGAVHLKKGDLAEYASIFGTCFDREVEWENEEDCPGTVMVRGFALSAKSVKEEAARVLAAANAAVEEEKEIRTEKI